MPFQSLLANTISTEKYLWSFDAPTITKGYTISSLVFPISGHSLYYNDSKTIFDSLTAILKKKLTLEILDAKSLTVQTDWKQSPTYERAEQTKSIDMGVE